MGYAFGKTFISRIFRGLQSEWDTCKLNFHQMKPDRDNQKSFSFSGTAHFSRLHPTPRNSFALYLDRF